MDISRSETLKPKNRQKLLWLLHRLTGLHERFCDKEWIQLCSRTLKGILGRNYQQTIFDAVKFGYIQVKNTYLAGKRSKSYRLTNGIDADGKVAWVECTDAILKNNIIRSRVRKAKDDALTIASSDLDLWLRESLLDVGFAKAYEMNNDVQLLTQGYPDYTICPYGRRHTPFVRLPSRIRASVSFRSKPDAKVIEIDIRNSQPVFLLVELMGKKCSTYNHSEQGDSVDVNLMPSPPPSHPPPLCGTLLRFKDDIENGELYDKMMGELGMSDRKAFKDQFFAYILYGKAGKWTEDLPIVRVFVKLYPEAWRLINEAKADDYRDLARRMQRRESDFIYNRVLPRLMAKCPTARVLTVHDAIYCEQRHKHDLIGIMNEEFEKIGVKASLRVLLLAEEWHDTKGISNTATARPGETQPDQQLPCSRKMFFWMLDEGFDARDCKGDWRDAFADFIVDGMPRLSSCRPNRPRAVAQESVKGGSEIGETS